VTIAAQQIRLGLLQAMISGSKQVLLAARCADVQLVATVVATKDVIRARELLTPPEVATGAAAGRRSNRTADTIQDSIPRYHEDLFRAAGFDSDITASDSSESEADPYFSVVAILLDGHTQPIVSEPKLSDLLKLKLPHTPGLPGVLPPAFSSLLGMGGSALGKCSRTSSSSAGLAPQLRPLAGLVMAQGDNASRNGTVP